MLFQTTSEQVEFELKKYKEKLEIELDKNESDNHYYSVIWFVIGAIIISAFALLFYNAEHDREAVNVKICLEKQCSYYHEGNIRECRCGK
jgi:hypothetical protein